MANLQQLLRGKSLKNVITGVLVGIVMILGSIPLLFWNEGRAVQTARSLDEGADAVVSVDSDSVDSQYDGELIHLTDEAVTDDTVSDPEFPIERQAIALQRSVEMYQWHEEERTEGTGDDQRTVYEYHTDWADREIDSGQFRETQGHQNPSMPYGDNIERAQHVEVGAFQLSQSFIQQFRNFRNVTLDDEFLEAARDGLGFNNEEVHLAQGRLYLGQNPANPKVGDVRIQFGTVEPHTVSVVGKQDGSTLAGYATEAGDTLRLMYEGHMTADEVFERAHQENVIITWAIRIGGSFAMFIGFLLLFGPISFVARFIPIVGRLIIGAKQFVAGALTFFIAGGTIAIGWVFYRPLIGIPLLLFFMLVGAGLFALAFKVASGLDESDADGELTADDIGHV